MRCAPCRICPPDRKPSRLAHQVSLLTRIERHRKPCRCTVVNMQVYSSQIFSVVLNLNFHFIKFIIHTPEYIYIYIFIHIPGLDSSIYIYTQWRIQSLANVKLMDVPKSETLTKLFTCSKQFRAAKSLCTYLLDAKYAMPFATCDR